MGLLLGIDVGTSGLKAIAIDETTGYVEARATRDYPLSTPHVGWAEQEPADFLAAAEAALASLGGALGARAREVVGIGLTGQMHTAVLLDGSDAVVRPAILWCDTRTTKACAAITEKLGAEGLRRSVGNLALEGFTLPKLLWLREAEPEAFARVRRVLMPKDWVGLFLTGEAGADVSDASGTLAFSPGARAWSDEVLAAFDVPRAWFPEAGESASVLGRLRPEIADKTGLPAGIPVVRGAADNAAGAVGLGVVREGRAMVSLGTSGVVLAATSSYVVEPEMRLHSFCHAVPERYYLMGVMLSAGGALRWYRDVLCDGERLAAELRRADPYEIVTEAASTARLGAGGLLFLPYLMGERTPHNDAAARGAFVGLSARTTKADFSRAVLEGISFGLADSLELVHAVLRASGRENGAATLREARVTGGGARSPFWRQLLADVLGLDVVVTTSTEGPAFGAAILAGVGAARFRSVEEGADALVHVTSRATPDPVSVSRYRAIHADYQALYGDLRGRFQAVARWA